MAKYQVESDGLIVYETDILFNAELSVQREYSLGADEVWLVNNEGV